MSDFALQRRMMVDGQLRTYDVMQSGVLAAMGDVPRELFVNAADRPVAYVDRMLTVGEGAHSRGLLTPMVLARLLQTAEIGPQDVVLVVGCATGYSAAVAGRLAGSVVAIESDEVLAAAATRALDAAGAGNVAVVQGPLDKGYAKEAPYDVIVVDGSFEAEPTHLLEQLREGGRLVGVKGAGRAGRAMLYRRSGSTYGGRPVFDAAAPALAELKLAPSFVF